MTVDELVAAAQGEGQLFSVGMPDEWANWKSLWAYITDTYGINHSDTDMSSAEELARFALEGKADADIGDIGISMTRCGHGAQDLLLPYKAHDLGFHPRLRQGRKRKMDHGLYLHHRLHDRP